MSCSACCKALCPCAPSRHRHPQTRCARAARTPPAPDHMWFSGWPAPGCLLSAACAANTLASDGLSASFVCLGQLAMRWLYRPALLGGLMQLMQCVPSGVCRFAQGLQQVSRVCSASRFCASCARRSVSRPPHLQRVLIRRAVHARPGGARLRRTPAGLPIYRCPAQCRPDPSDRPPTAHTAAPRADGVGRARGFGCLGAGFLRMLSACKSGSTPSSRAILAIPHNLHVRSAW